MDTVSWVPVDITASIIVDLVLANASDDHNPSSSSSSAVPSNVHHYNLVNPYPGAWHALIPPVIQYFQDGSKRTTDAKKSDSIEPVPFTTWLSALQASAALGTEDVAKNPGIKLLDFYKGMAEEGAEDEVLLETEVTVGTSENMRRLTPVGEEWMRIWLEQWEF